MGSSRGYLEALQICLLFDSALYLVSSTLALRFVAEGKGPEMLKAQINIFKIQLYILSYLRVVPNKIGKMYSRYLEREQKMRMNMKQCMQYFNTPRTWISALFLSVLGS